MNTENQDILNNEQIVTENTLQSDPQPADPQPADPQPADPQPAEPEDPELQGIKTKAGLIFRLGRGYKLTPEEDFIKFTTGKWLRIQIIKTKSTCKLMYYKDSDKEYRKSVGKLLLEKVVQDSDDPYNVTFYGKKKDNKKRLSKKTYKRVVIFDRKTISEKTINKRIKNIANKCQGIVETETPNLEQETIIGGRRTRRRNRKKRNVTRRHRKKHTKNKRNRNQKRGKKLTKRNRK